MGTMSFVRISTGPVNLVILLTFLEKFLDTLNSADYATFAEALHPELQKAKRINAGNGVKNIPAVNCLLHVSRRLHVC